ncbi:MAG: hypothetical protein POELPBGB_03623 [Bacteroidia bacterium]|nr:hypothetical protein [Bacteroidia bacterium]
METMKNKTQLPVALTLAALLFILLSISSCTTEKKQGCTNNTAINFNSDADEDNGNCMYNAQETIWWNQDFSDAAETNGVSYFLIYVDGVKLDNEPEYDENIFSSAPSCSETSAIVVSRQLAEGDIIVLDLVIEAYDVDDNLVESITDEITLQTFMVCNYYQVEPYQFGW